MWTPGSGNEAAEAELRFQLRWLADTYERVQRIRIESGERIRAVAQGRAAGALAERGNAARLLIEIRSGRVDGPVPVLGHTYRVHWHEETRLRAAMGDALAGHPAWPWLRQVKGVGPTLATKLLARLDLRRAPTPSSFWSYCGLATVNADVFYCSRCNATRLLARGRRPRTGRGHLREMCDGEWTGETSAARVAPPSTRGERVAFDRSARRVCYLLGISLLRANGSYASFYRTQRRMLEHSTRGWSDGHVHMAALRKTEKLFLAHLWSEWRRELGMGAIRPYSQSHLHQSYIAPAEMIEP
jgi:hypothetical protein